MRKQVSCALILMMCGTVLSLSTGCGDKLGKTDKTPLGGLKKLDEHIKAMGFERLSDEKKQLPGSTEEARIRVYKDKTTTRGSNSKDLIVVVADSKSTVRGVGAVFLQRSETNTHAGKAEGFIRGYWKQVTTKSPDPTDKKYGLEQDTATNDTLEATWSVRYGMAQVSVVMKDAKTVINDGGGMFNATKKSKKTSTKAGRGEKTTGPTPVPTPEPTPEPTVSQKPDSAAEKDFRLALRKYLEFQAAVSYLKTCVASSTPPIDMATGKRESKDTWSINRMAFKSRLSKSSRASSKNKTEAQELAAKLSKTVRSRIIAEEKNRVEGIKKNPKRWVATCDPTGSYAYVSMQTLALDIASQEKKLKSLEKEVTDVRAGKCSPPREIKRRSGESKKDYYQRAANLMSAKLRADRSKLSAYRKSMISTQSIYKYRVRFWKKAGNSF